MAETFTTADITATTVDPSEADSGEVIVGTGETGTLLHAELTDTDTDGHPASAITGLADVATSGDYADLINTPEPGGGTGLHADLTDTDTDGHPAAVITGLADVATSGDYDDLTNTPAAAGLLAVTNYAPAQTVYTRSTASLADVDATNLAVTFTAPASGKVLVRLAAFGDTNGTASEFYWGLREGTTDLTAARIARVADAESYLTPEFYITGLTAGSSHTYKWSYAIATGSSTTRLIIGPGGFGQFAPGLMTVWSAP